MRTGIRVGGMGSIDPTMALGSFVIVDRAMRNTGTGRVYAPSGQDLFASPAVVDALERAAASLGLPHRRGSIYTTDSYYWGQERLARPDEIPMHCHAMLIDQLTASGVAGMDMECEALFAVGHALDINVGAVLAVHGNRATDQWLEDYEETQHNLIRLAATE